MLARDETSQLDVLGHDGDSLDWRTDSEQCPRTDQLGKPHWLLKSYDNRALEAQIILEVLSDVSDQMLERQLADQT